MSNYRLSSKLVLIALGLVGDFAQEGLITKLGLVATNFIIFVEAVQIIAIQGLQAAARRVAMNSNGLDCGLGRSYLCHGALKRRIALISQRSVLLPDFGSRWRQAVKASGGDCHASLRRLKRVAHF